MERAHSTPNSTEVPSWPDEKDGQKDPEDTAGEEESETTRKFKQYDKNGDGRLGFAEFRDLLKGEGMSTYLPFILFFMLDKNGDGVIDCSEFVRFAKVAQAPLLQGASVRPRPPALKRLCTRIAGEPHYLQELSFHSAQPAGSHLGGFFSSDDGQKFYVKFPGLPPIHNRSDESRARFSALADSPRDFFDPGDSEEDDKQPASVRRQTKSEVLVSKLYSMVGVDAAVMRLVHIEGAVEDGPVGCWSRNQDYEDLSQPEMVGLPGLKEGFAADAWLANWDVIGNGAPHELNLKRTQGGRAFRLDFGGCLQYRAQGTDKSTARCPFVADSVPEVDNLRRFNYPFNDVTPADITLGVCKIAAVPDDAIKDVVKDVLGQDAAYQDTTIADILIGRKQALERQFPPPASIKISRKRSTAFYIRTATAMLKGGEGEAPVNILHITALGGAIPTAAAVSAKMEEDKLGRIASVSTAYQPAQEVEHGCGQLSITIHRC